MPHLGLRSWRAVIGVVALGLSSGGCAGSAHSHSHSRAHAAVDARGAYPSGSTMATPAAPARARSGVDAGAGAVNAAAETREKVEVVTADGAVVALRSGALYSVGPRDQAMAAAWTAGQAIAVAPGGDGLTNLARRESVGVTAAGDTYLADPYADPRSHRERTDSNNGAIIVLSDGSIWFVPDPADRITASRWHVGAAIVALSGTLRTEELINTGAPSAIQASYVGYE